MATVENRIRALAQISVDQLNCCWMFVPVRQLPSVDDDCYLGELYYENVRIEVGAALRIKDWVFCREQMRLPGAPKILGAFHGSDHYSFGPDTSSNGTEFVNTILDRFFSIIVPDKSLKEKLEIIPVLSHQESLNAQRDALTELGAPRLLTGGGTNGRPPLDPPAILGYIMRHQ